MTMPHAPQPPLLFVYGTLKRGCSNPWSRRLWSTARFLGEGSLPGRLYSLGPYPAFIDDPAAGGPVHGEVAALADESILRELDAYEGPQYLRARRRVRLASGAGLAAWVYIFRGPLGHARRLPDGRWPVQ